MARSGTIETVVDLVRQRALHQPEKIAFTYLEDRGEGEINISFSQLDQAARAIAARLQHHVEPGERALLLYRNDLSFVSAFIGCLYAGVVAVPAGSYEGLTHLRRKYSICIDARPRVVMATSSYWDTILPMGEEHEGQSTRQFLRLATDDLSPELANQWSPPQLTADDTAFLQYTSGSTSDPKGVMVSHGNILANQEMIQRGFGHTQDSVVVGWLPLFHDMGLIGHVLQPLYLGCRSVLLSPACILQRPIRWLQAVTRYGGTTTGGPNFGYDRCVALIKASQRDTLDLRSLQVAYNGAEPVRESTLNRFADYFAPCGFRREAFLPCYGLAETTLFVTGCDWKAAPVIRRVRRHDLEQSRFVVCENGEANSPSLVGCGASQFDARVAIVDPETCRRSPPDTIGEIWVSGRHVAQGYYERPEESKATFAAFLADTGEGPFLRTGDLGCFHDGQLFITGRAKDLIIIYGRNHYPHPIERSVEDSHPGFQPGGACAFAAQVDGAEKLVIVQTVERRAMRNDLHPMIEAIRETVAEEHELSVFAVCLIRSGRLPKTSSGKTQRRLCKHMWQHGELDPLHQWTLQPMPHSHEHRPRSRRRDGSTELVTAKSDVRRT